MTEFHKRALPRLMLDTANCLQLAQGDLDNDLRTETRDSIVALLGMDAPPTLTAPYRLCAPSRSICDT